MYARYTVQVSSLSFQPKGEVKARLHAASSVAAVDRLEEVTDGQLTGIDLWRSRSRLEIAVTSPYGHDHGQAV